MLLNHETTDLIEQEHAPTSGVVKFKPQQTRMKLGALREGVKLAASFAAGRRVGT
jgi:hypothetical protein